MSSAFISTLESHQFPEKAQTFMKIFENSECAPLCKSIETNRFSMENIFPSTRGPI